MSKAAIKHLSRKGMYLFIESHGKGLLVETAVLRRKCMDHLQLKNQPNQKEENRNKWKGEKKNRNVPEKAENLQGLIK